MNNQLNETQKDILKKFINSFLPPKGNKRKSSGNEIEYVGTTLDRLFKQNFGFNISRWDILHAFEDLQYNIFTKGGQWDSDKKIHKPSVAGKVVRVGDGYSEYIGSFVYIDVDSLTMRQLRLSTSSLPAHTAKEKFEETEKMKARIGIFKQSVLEK